MVSALDAEIERFDLAHRLQRQRESFKRRLDVLKGDEYEQVRERVRDLTKVIYALRSRKTF